MIIEYLMPMPYNLYVANKNGKMFVGKNFNWDWIDQFGLFSLKIFIIFRMNFLWKKILEKLKDLFDGL